MLNKRPRLMLSLIFTCASLFALMLLLNAAGDRSAAAQPIGDSSAPVSLQSTTPFTIGLQFVANGLAAPVHVTDAHDNTGRLFVVEQAGTIRVIKNGSLLGTPYLDIHTRVESGGSEQGLLSVAFDPNYQTNGTFYVDYTTNASGHDGDTVIARYVISNPLSDVGTVISVTNLITIDQPESNHNGGQLQFGPDGYLYIGMGDGGGGGDLHGTIGNGQNLSALLGKILRINVQGVPTYTLPPSNPFTQTLNARPEIWAYGLRNPWRFSFDRSTGDLYIGDVGQGCWEEIDYQPAGSHGGENYGWRLMEGFHYFDPNNQGNCSQPTINLITLTLPITNYSHTQSNNAVVGGYVYRGSQYLWLNGIYFYSDEGSGRIWAAQPISSSEWSISQELDSPYSISSFGEDQSGELYVADYGGGAIYKIVSAPPIDFSASTKQVSSSTAQSGGIITYTIVLRNSRNLISNTLRVTDVIPIGLSYVNGSFTATRGTPIDSAVPTLNWSGVMSNTSIVTLTYAASVVTTTNQTITNAAVIDPAIVVPLTRTASVVIVNPSPDLSTSTKHASTSSAIFGDSVTYTIVLRNTGLPFSNTLYVTDVVPTSLSYLPGSLVATRGVVDASAAPTLKWMGNMSGTAPITISLAVTVATKIGQTIVNVAAIDPVVTPPLTRSASVTILNAPPDLAETTKQASDANAVFGDSVTYTIVLRNTGGPFTNTVRLTDTVPIGLNYLPGSFTATHGTVDASSAPTLKWNGVLSNTAAITLTYAVTVATLSGQTITNTAAIDPAVLPGLARSASISIANAPPNFTASTKQASKATAKFGEVISYTIVLRNSGGPLTTTARLTDVVPASLSYLSGSLAATLGTLDDSAPPTLKWYGLISAAPVVTISYAARVATAANQMAINVVTIDPAISPVFTRSASVAIASPVPDLSPTTKQVSASTAALGDTLTYTIVLRNGGDAFPQTVYITDTLPISLGYIIGSFGATSGTPDASAAPTLKWHGALSATSIITLTYAVTVTTSAAQVITNRATVDVGLGTPFTRSASVLVNGWRVYLPLILKAF